MYASSSGVTITNLACGTSHAKALHIHWQGKLHGALQLFVCDSTAQEGKEGRKAPRTIRFSVMSFFSFSTAIYCSSFLSLPSALKSLASLTMSPMVEHPR